MEKMRKRFKRTCSFDPSSPSSGLHKKNTKQSISYPSLTVFSIRETKCACEADHLFPVCFPVFLDLFVFPEHADWSRMLASLNGHKTFANDFSTITWTSIKLLVKARRLCDANHMEAAVCQWEKCSAAAAAAWGKATFIFPVWAPSSGQPWSCFLTRHRMF